MFSRRRNIRNDISFNKFFLFLGIIFILYALTYTNSKKSESQLELVNDEELLTLIKTEKYVVVLFTKKDCEVCDKYETELVHIREDIVDSLNAWVVKAVNSPMVRLYSSTKEPALVFFRHGNPLLYDGPLNDEFMLHTLTDNKAPIVKELSDDTFEHLTQASTGATTGDWLVMFYSNECVDCQRLQARWEAVGSKLKIRMNTARVNKETSGAATSRRFEVQEVPTFILFRQGKYYRYSLSKYDVASLVSFAEHGYKNARGVPVPVPLSPFDDLTIAIANYLRENQWLFTVGLGTFGIGILLALWHKMRSSKQKSPEKKKK